MTNLLPFPHGETEFYYVDGYFQPSSRIKLKKSEIDALASAYQIYDARELAIKIGVWKSIFEANTANYDNRPSPSTMRDELEKVRSAAERLSKAIEQLGVYPREQISFVHLLPSTDAIEVLETNCLLTRSSRHDMLTFDLSTAQIAIDTIAFRASELVHHHHDSINPESLKHPPVKDKSDLGLEGVKIILSNLSGFWQTTKGQSYKPHFRSGQTRNNAAEFTVEVFAIIAPQITGSQIDTAVTALKYREK